MKGLLSWIHGGDRVRALTIAGALVAAIAAVDWRVTANLGLGFLYFFPVLLVSPFLSRFQILALAAGCVWLTEHFSPLAWDEDSWARIMFRLVSFAGVGWFVREAARNRELVENHLRDVSEQVRLRQGAEDRLRALIETSPAAIVTLDSKGVVLMANEAAHRLLALDSGCLPGRPMETYLPVLSKVLRSGGVAPSLRTTMESRGHRANGEIFLAHVWFSTYPMPSGPQLAAIILDASDELRDREETGLQRLLSQSRILVRAVSHEIRNLCGAISVVHSNLQRLGNLEQNKDFEALGMLAEALRKLASADLRPLDVTAAAGVDVQAVLDDLRIIVEPAARDSGIHVCWNIPHPLPKVIADPHGLLQVFLNLVDNSRRALQDVAQPELRVTAREQSGRVVVRVEDNGAGVSAPEALFQPFQNGADVHGLGLYVSRAILRGFAGELRFERRPQGCCFAVELTAAEPAARVA